MITTKSYFKKSTFQNMQMCTEKVLQNTGLKWFSLRHTPILCANCNTCSNCYYIDTTLNSSFEIVRSFSWPLNPIVWWAYFFRKKMTWIPWMCCAFEWARSAWGAYPVFLSLAGSNSHSSCLSISSKRQWFLLQNLWNQHWE